METLDDEAVAGVERRLLDALAANVPSSPLEPLHVTARQDEGTLAGAMVGGISYGWLHVGMLWVAEERRNRGLGRELMALAEREALARGCHGAWLDTSSRRARAFYARLGYETFGRLGNTGADRPAGHERHFMAKRLAAPREGAGDPPHRDHP